MARLRRGLLLPVLAGAVLGALLAAGASVLAPDRHRATALLELRTATGAAEPAPARPAEVDAAASTVDLGEVVASVDRATGTTGAGSGGLSAERRPSGLLAVTGRASTPQAAATRARAAALVLLERRARARRSGLQRRVAALGRALPLAAPPDRPALADALRTLRARAEASTDVGELAAAPSAADARRTRPPLPWAAAGAVLGGLLALALVLLLRRLRRRVGGAEAIGRLVGLPPVAQLPPVGRGPREQRRTDEAVRGLCAAVERTGAGVVAVTSAVPGEGKTDVVARTARALARGGRRVVAVEADLRRPALAGRLDPSSETRSTADDGPERGLTAALLSGAPATTMLEDAAGVRVLRRGPAVPGGPELMATDDVSRVLAELAADADVVLLDTAPLLPVADTPSLLGRPEVGLVLLVVRSGHVRAEDLTQARRVVADAGSAPVRLVVNDEPGAGRRYDAYLAAADEPSA